MSAFAWIDGRPVAACAAVDLLSSRGLAYGDGLFETISVRAGQARFLRQHWERLRFGCLRLQLELDEVALAHEVTSALAAGIEGVLKIIVTRGGIERGYRPQVGVGCRRLLQFFSQPVADAMSQTQPAVLHLCRQRLSCQPALAGLKHLNRLEQVLARSEWNDPSITEGLMLDTQGRVIEAVSSNVFAVRAGSVSTPSLHACGVAGVMRRVVMEELDVAVQEVAMTLEDLYAADEVFITSTQRGIQPVMQLGCVHWQTGSVTTGLQRNLQQLVAANALTTLDVSSIR